MEETNKTQPDFNTQAIQTGIILGFTSIIFYLGAYIIDVSYIVNWKFGLTLYIIYLILAIILGRKYRSEIGGYMSYGEAFKFSFFAFTVSGVIAILFNIVLYNVIDPELPANLTKIMIETQEQMFSSLGVSDDILDEAILKLEEDVPKQYTTIGQLKSSWVVLIFALILGAISALFIKKNKPEFAPE